MGTNNQLDKPKKFFIFRWFSYLLDSLKKKNHSPMLWDDETEARINGYFNLEEINNAILETNGKISFEPKEKPLSKKEDNPIVYNLIIDGEIIEDNLKHINKNKSWLNHELKVLGKKKEDILLLTSDKTYKINIYLKH